MSPHELSAQQVVLAPAGVPADAVGRIQRGRISVVGRMRNASNATFLVRLDDPAIEADSADEPDSAEAVDVERDDPEPDDPGGRLPWGLAIYKPERGERPLWDFEPGLWRREVAAYILSRATGLGVVPPTVVRPDAPLGEGSLQWFVNADFAHHYFSIAEERPDLQDQLRAIAAFDVLANNTDRKSGHCLLEISTNGDRHLDHVWAIDNGLCFAEEFKLRTVIWEFAGELLPASVVEAVSAVATNPPDALAGLLSEEEIDAVTRRARRLLDLGVFPVDRSGRGYPWPLV